MREIVLECLCTLGHIPDWEQFYVLGQQVRVGIAACRTAVGYAGRIGQCIEVLEEEFCIEIVSGRRLCRLDRMSAPPVYQSSYVSYYEASLLPTMGFDAECSLCRTRFPRNQLAFGTLFCSPACRDADRERSQRIRAEEEAAAWELSQARVALRVLRRCLTDADFADAERQRRGIRSKRRPRRARSNSGRA